LNTARLGLVPITSRAFSKHIGFPKHVAKILNASVGAENSKLGQWEKETWPHLRDLAQNFPEAGIHFQGTLLLLI
jgi:hypothetical protein